MSRRRRHAAHANHERWLVSYADFITLLFAFFVVLYASSQVDRRKVGKLAMSIQVAFQELGVFPASNTTIPIDSRDPLPFNAVQAIENAERTAALGRIASAPKDVLSASEGGDLSSLRQELELALALEIQRNEVALRSEPDGLVVSLREIGFFDSGSAQIRQNSRSAFGRIAALLSARNCRIRIEGHTDNIPIHNTRFSDNWELSTGRSAEIVRLLIVKYGFSPDRLSAAGYAEYHPVASNNSPETRAQNRRVDVVILGKPPASSPATLPNAEARGSPQRSSPPTPTSPESPSQPAQSKPSPAIAEPQPTT